MLRIMLGFGSGLRLEQLLRIFREEEEDFIYWG